ncbi:MAG: hypothetical protein PV358_16060 [Acidimicrobiales bacterium]|nr:hypothetical protein [Acidimicrobiales bacterium]
MGAGGERLRENTSAPKKPLARSAAGTATSALPTTTPVLSITSTTPAPSSRRP